MNWLLLFIPVAIGLEFLSPERSSPRFRNFLPCHSAACRMDGPSHGTVGGAAGRRGWRAAQCDFRQCGRAHHRPGRAACRAPRCREGVDCRVHCREYPACARRRHAGRRIAPSGAALQSGRGALPGDDAHARGDRVDPAGRLSSRGGNKTADGLGKLSVSISIVLLLVYLLYLMFTLVTHSSLVRGLLRARGRGSARAAWPVPSGRASARRRRRR